MMREHTVVHKLQMAICGLHPFEKLSVHIVYVDGDVPMAINSQNSSKDEMVSQLFDLAMRGYYVGDMTNIYFPSEQVTTLFLRKSEKMRTNLNSCLMEQIGNVLDRVCH